MVNAISAQGSQANPLSTAVVSALADMSQFYMNYSSEEEDQSPMKVTGQGPSAKGASPTITTPPIGKPDLAKMDEKQSGDKVPAPQARKPPADVTRRLFSESALSCKADGKVDQADDKSDEAAPPPAKKAKAAPKKKITLSPSEDKSSKPRGSDKNQRKSRGEALAFAGYRPPNDPVLREQFLRINQNPGRLIPHSLST